MTILKFRTLFLYAIAAVFFGEAAIALFAPGYGAETMGYAIQNTDGWSELRAVYLGMWSVLGTVAVLGARRPQELIFGDIVAWAIVGESFARILSLALDGAAGPITYLHIVMELSPIALLLARPGLSWRTFSPRAVFRSFNREAIFDHEGNRVVDQ